MPATALCQAMLPVRDLARSVAFYRDTLGATLTASFPPGLAFFSDPDGHTLALAWRGAAQGDPDE